MPNRTVFKWFHLHIIEEIPHRCVLLHCVDHRAGRSITLSVLTRLTNTMELDDVNVRFNHLERSELAHKVSHLALSFTLVLKLENFDCKTSFSFHSVVDFTRVTFTYFFDKPILVYL